MAKSLKDILMTPVDTDMSAEGFRRAFGISDYLGKSKAAKRTKVAAEDMKKRITEKSNVGPGVSNKKYPTGLLLESERKSPKNVKIKETVVETPTGNLGSVDRNSDVIGPDMGRVNREAPVLDLSTQYMPEASGDDHSTWVDPHEQARRMMGFKKGGAVKAKKKSSCGMKSGGSVKASGASKRADGCALRGKTKGRMV